VKQALFDALAREGVDAATAVDIVSRSMGESQPLASTADGVKNDRNRRVEISVHIGPKAAAPTSTPSFDPLAPLPPDTVRDEGLWRRMKANQKKIEELDRTPPRTNKSLSEALIDKVMDNLIDPIIDGLPVSKGMRDLARSGVRKGLAKGSEAACNAGIDAAGATGEHAEALKAACKAALEAKPGGAGGGTP
jgi:hypothetical protein